MIKKMNENINRVESVLFSSGRKISLEDLKKICRIKNDDEILEIIEELKKRYDNETSLMIIEEGNAWKMTVREKYLQFIKKIVTDTELSKTIMETLAVIAWKNPAYQSDVIKIRTNKAYDHISELEEAGFIEGSKHGRTKLLKLTKKFYDYFDLESDKDIKKVFGDVRHPKLPQTKVVDFEEENKTIENDDQIIENENLFIQNEVQVVDLNEENAKNINLEVYEQNDLSLQNEKVIIVDEGINDFDELDDLNQEENLDEDQKVEIIDDEIIDQIDDDESEKK
jgi:segregation and condensation protein B